jgi:hypothetical protein
MTKAAQTSAATTVEIDSILRLRLSRFLVQRADWKQPLRFVTNIFKNRDWRAVVFGGVLRDLILYGPASAPRDVDIVVDCESAELSECFSGFDFALTRFGGLRVQYKKWNFDIWSLDDTWAFKVTDMPATFENLPKTTFFNVEAIAAELNATRGRERSLYSYGFADAIASRTLDINFERNPFPQLCIARALLMAARHSFLISARLAQYITEQASHTEINDILQAQAKHYGVPRLRARHIAEWLGHIENSLRRYPEEPVKLPITAGEQLHIRF